MGPNGESLSLMTPETFVATVTFTDRTASFGYGIDISGERVRLIGVNTPEMKHPTKQVEYSARKPAPLPSAWLKENLFGSSTTPSQVDANRKTGISSH